MVDVFVENSDVVGSIPMRYLGEGGGFSAPVVYRSGTARRILYCVYVSWVTDDVAVGGLKHDFPKATKREPRGR